MVGPARCISVAFVALLMDVLIPVVAFVLLGVYGQCRLGYLVPIIGGTYCEGFACGVSFWHLLDYT